MTKPSAFSFRLDPPVVDLLEQVSEQHRLPPAMMIERLVVEEAKRLHLVKPDDPRVAFHLLMDWVRDLVVNEPLTPESDLTRTVFERIQADPEALRLWSLATIPRPNERVTKRRQYANARLGRFCKALIGWESDREIVLPRNAGLLIRGYTRLRPP